MAAHLSPDAAPAAGMPSTGTTLLTVGHGRLGRDALGDLLRSAGVEVLVDVRRYPGSRGNPDVSRDALAGWLPAAGIGYRWEEQLGGRRRLTAEEDRRSPDTWWRVAQFRAYAAWTRSPEFGHALAQVLALAAGDRVAVMCSESVWWRCHRRLIADVATLAHGAEVRHLMHDGGLREHPVAEGARRATDGTVLWDGE